MIQRYELTEQGSLREAENGWWMMASHVEAELAAKDAEIASLTAALALLPGEPVAWEVAETLPSGSRRWQVVEHENHARKLAEKLNADVRPLYAAPAPLPVAVKGLDWIAPSKSTNYCWMAKSPFGTYSVVDEDGWYAAREPGDYWEWNGDRIIDTRDSAFRACETDYEARIRSALCDVSPAPASDIAALREENERLREALRPFSAEADHYRDSAGGVLIESGMGDVRDAEYNISDLRRARTLVHSALSQQEESRG